MRGRNQRLGEMLTIVVRKRGEAGFCFDDLLPSAEYHGATIGELAEWMAQARSHGVIEAVVTDPAERTLGRRFRFVKPGPITPSRLEHR